MFNFIEFFAGGGMARAGLGPEWNCLFANDFDEHKASSYRANWGADHLFVGDIATVTASQVQGPVDLAWASSPCQDLSVAGGQAGLAGRRSGTFWSFWKLMRELLHSGRAPRLIVLENVLGTLTSRGGADFAAIGDAFGSLGYNFGAIVVDARLFVPQSRGRVFVIGVRDGTSIPEGLLAGGPTDAWHSNSLRAAYQHLSPSTKARWLWWSPPVPALRNTKFIDVIEDHPQGVKWHSAVETRYLIDMMSKVNRQKLDKMIAQTAASRGRVVGGVYRRTRDGQQRAEVRFDDVAGCLRTPTGGSSRQTVMIVDRGQVRSRLLSSREAARLMGLPDTYIIPGHYNRAYHLLGDGLVVPVVRHIACEILEPVLAKTDVEAVAAE